MVRRKNALLLGLAQTGKQRHHLGPACQRLMRQMPPQMVGGATNLALTGQKHQNVARLLRALPQRIHRLGNGRIKVAVTRFFKRLPTHLNRV